MKALKFSEAQIAFVLKQAADDAVIGDGCHKAGISEATFYNWRKKYAGLMPSEMMAAPAACCQSFFGQGYASGCLSKKL